MGSQRPSLNFYAARLLVAFAGTRVRLYGGGRTFLAAARAWREAEDRHAKFWLDYYLRDGASITEIRDATGLGKKTIRRRLIELEAEGRVRRVAVVCGPNTDTNQRWARVPERPA